MNIHGTCDLFTYIVVERFMCFNEHESHTNGGSRWVQPSFLYGSTNAKQVSGIRGHTKLSIWCYSMEVRLVLTIPPANSHTVIKPMVDALEGVRCFDLV